VAPLPPGIEPTGIRAVDVFFTAGPSLVGASVEEPSRRSRSARAALPGPLLAATLFLPPEARSTRVPGLVVGHGAGSRRTRHKAFCLEACRAGFAVLSLDFRGHGDSQGLADGPMEEDVLAAVRVLREMPEVDPKAICYRGSSMGGFYGLMAAPDAAFAAMVLICPASEKEFLDALDKGEIGSDNQASAAQDEGPVHFAAAALDGPPRWDTEALRRYFETRDSLGIAARVCCPVLLIHARADDVVPLGHSLALVRHLAGDATLLVLSEGGHSTAQHDPRMHRQSLAWLRQCLGQPSPPD
jgi:uncharacterized protein